jgi:hypothetical protein
MTRAFSPVLVMLGVLGFGCGPANIELDSEGGPLKKDGGGNSQNDAPIILDAPHQEQDGPHVLEDASQRPDNCATQSCAPVEDNCLSGEICGNGLDDDCNGTIDDGCPPGCVPGSVQPCFLGPPGRRNVGMCQDGTQTCQGSGEFGQWGPCEGGIFPTAEACDTQDNDCNGCADDSYDCCVAAIQCPNQMPDGLPYADYVIDGTGFYPGAAMAWSWKVEGGPCDKMLWSTSSKTTYKLNGTANTTTVMGATTSTLTFHPTLSGDYTVTMTVGTADGPLTCTFLVHIKGPGFRTELCWDKTGSTDIDLHLHRPGTTTPWFTTDGTSTGATNNDDCYYLNCRASNLIAGTGPSWGYAHTSVDNCKGAPDDGSQWTAPAVGYCASPRLDVDNISVQGKPENINVDNPNNAEKFRVMVHYYGGVSVVVHPMINIYCGGKILATYGQDPDFVPNYNKSGGFANGSGGAMWRVVDVTTAVDASGETTGCDLEPLHAPGQTSGYWVTKDTNLSY